MKKFSQVMLIDDDYVFNLLHKSMLFKLNIAEQFLIKQNGKVALEFIYNHCIGNQVGCPDLILLDLNMPVMDGFELLEELNKNQQKVLIRSRIVVVTSSNNPEEIKRLRNLGVSIIFQKPLTEEMAISLLDMLEDNA